LLFNSSKIKMHERIIKLKNFERKLQSRKAKYSKFCEKMILKNERIYFQ